MDLPAGAEIGSAFGAARLAMLAAGGSETEVCVKPPVRRSFAPRPPTRRSRPNAASTCRRFISGE
jgi:xylulokinase